MHVGNGGEKEAERITKRISFSTLEPGRIRQSSDFLSIVLLETSKRTVVDGPIPRVTQSRFPTLNIMAANHSSSIPQFSFLDLSPSSEDLLMAMPRMFARLHSFLLHSLPERLESVLGLGTGEGMIADATREGVYNLASTGGANGAAFAQGTAPAMAVTTGIGATTGSPLSSTFGFQHIKNFGGVFSYMTSKWALGCFTVVCLACIRQDVEH